MSGLLLFEGGNLKKGGRLLQSLPPIYGARFMRRYWRMLRSAR